MRPILSKTKGDGLIFDLETVGRLSRVYGKSHEPVESYVVRRGFLLSVAYMWASEAEDAVSRARKGSKVKYPVHYMDIKQSTSHNLDPENDREIATALFDLWQHAGWGLAYNGDNFDLKASRTYFAEHNLVPHKLKSIDPLKIARKEFLLPNYRLDTVADFLKVTGKMSVNLSYITQKAVEDDDPTAWKKLEEYNRRDVESLYELWVKIRPYASSHLNMAILSQEYDACPRCGKSETVIRNGSRYDYTNSYRYQSYYCSRRKGGCGYCPRGRKAKEKAVPRYT